MEIQDRINKIKQYFINFNIVEGYSYILAKFPPNWKMPKKEELMEAYGVKIAADPKGICFFTEFSNSTDMLFDAVEYIIDFNEKLMERVALFKEKMNELNELFSSEDLETLKTLEFKFGKKKKNKKKEKIMEAPELPEKAEEDEIHSSEDNEPESEMMALVEKMVEE